MDSKTRVKKASITEGTGCRQPGKKKTKERKSSRLNVFIYSAGVESDIQADGYRSFRSSLYRSKESAEKRRARKESREPDKEFIHYLAYAITG
ncbi:hypothetical protein AVEN_175255-1 [Araneus ventricosus]|uniref:Uncharacterized protein n=1 Tax=Araneus ventricosus TaxID=182803 RepID=A0A4Y2F1F9_ARAVE|nr:hypothetical protein AVEN_175255-1 [Araneus ventricosus]